MSKKDLKGKDEGMQKGQITKALSGFYYVTDEEGTIYQTRARGVFRKRKLTPLVGDYVHFESENQKEGTVVELLPRGNELSRPPVANVDIGVVVTSAVDPDFSTQLLDRFLVVLEYNHIQPVIYITKMDLVTEEQEKDIRAYKKDYEKLGYTFVLPEKEETMTKEHVEENFQDLFKDKVVVFMGQSGAGKSTLLNTLNPSLEIKTAETSRSLGRGRHTTRHVELLRLLNGWIADTPGFSSIAFEDIEAEELTQCFPEMWAKRAECKFSGCMHDKEPKCAVKEAVKTREIASYRYEHYLLFLEEIRNRKPDYSKKR